MQRGSIELWVFWAIGVAGNSMPCGMLVLQNHSQHDPSGIFSVILVATHQAGQEDVSALQCFGKVGSDILFANVVEESRALQQ